MNKRLLGPLTCLGEILVIIGAAIWITGWKGAGIVFAIGAVVFAACRIIEHHCNGYDDKPLTLRRLYRQRMIGAVMVVISAVMMLFYDLSPTGWLVPFIVFTVTEIYTAFRIPKCEQSSQV